MAKDTFYFSHDYNARNDEKIKLLIRKHGMFGYGVFWAIVEELYNNANALRTHYDSISYDLRTDEDLIKSIVEDFGLFVIDGDFFGSISIERRLEERNMKSIKARESAIKRWSKCERNANASNNNANELKIDAIKEIKEIKESMSDKIGFEKFWELYDKKSSKIKSQKLWDKLTKEEKVIVMEHVPRYVKSTPQKQFRKDPSTYLNNKSFNDEIIERNPTLFPSQQHANTVKIVV